LLFLRAERLEARPRLAMTTSDGELRVAVRRARMPQLAELEVRLQDETERSWTLRPSGVLDASSRARARLGILLFDSGSREIELYRAPLPAHPAGGRWMRATARLLNPGSAGSGSAWEAVSDRAMLEL
jgi:hypothetical protein